MELSYTLALSAGERIKVGDKVKKGQLLYEVTKIVEVDYRGTVASVICETKLAE